MKQGVQDAQKNYQFANAKKNEQLYNHVSNKIEHSQQHVNPQQFYPQQQSSSNSLENTVVGQAEKTAFMNS